MTPELVKFIDLLEMTAIAILAACLFVYCALVLLVGFAVQVGFAKVSGAHLITVILGWGFAAPVMLFIAVFFGLFGATGLVYRWIFKPRDYPDSFNRQ